MVNIRLFRLEESHLLNFEVEVAQGLNFAEMKWMFGKFIYIQDYLFEIYRRDELYVVSLTLFSPPHYRVAVCYSSSGCHGWTDTEQGQMHAAEDRSSYGFYRDHIEYRDDTIDCQVCRMGYPRWKPFEIRKPAELLSKLTGGKAAWASLQLFNEQLQHLERLETDYSKDKLDFANLTTLFSPPGESFTCDGMKDVNLWKWKASEDSTRLDCGHRIRSYFGILPWSDDKKAKRLCPKCLGRYFVLAACHQDTSSYPEWKCQTRTSMERIVNVKGKTSDLEDEQCMVTSANKVISSVG